MKNQLPNTFKDGGKNYIRYNIVNTKPTHIMNSDNYNKYTMNSYSGTELLKKHSVEESGVWEIYGEDPNCDLGGNHHEPHLDTVEGKLHDVIEYAVDLPRFWQWGVGGRIVKQKMRKTILNVSKNKEALRRIKELRKIINDATQELGELENGQQ